MITKYCAAQLTIALFASLFVTHAWAAPFQTVSIASETVAVPGNNFVVEIVYNTSDGNANLPGLGMRVHFNAAELTWVQNTLVNELDLIGTSPATADVEDFDNSSDTDTYIQFAWASVSGNWPGKIPADLARLEFNTLDSFDGTTINFSTSGTAAGYAFQSAQVDIGLSNSTVDSDNDGLPDECDNACLAAGITADTDDDNDGVLDVDDAFPLDPLRSDDDASNLAPTIAIAGLATITLDVDDVFTDPGALAFDEEDGDLTASVIVSDDVNISAPGSYTVEYRVTDSGGLTTMVTRTVVVIQPLSSGALRFAAGQVVELPVIGTALTAPNGDALVVPTTATAASINVTAVTPGGSGFITVWPCGVARPVASNLNYVAGDVVPNGVLAPIGSNGKVCIYSLVDTDLVVDVAGWFEGDAFVGATPLRLRDTRETSRVTSTQELVLQVADIDASTADGSATRVPADVGAVALNVTVVSPDSAGFVTVYPCGTRPLASNVNYTAGQIVPNGVIAPVSANGEVCIYSLAPTDIIVDLAGWFPGDAFTAATPQRLVDTRDGTGGQQGKLIPTGQLNVPVHGQTLSVSGNSAQVPLSATAAALNVTIVNPERAGFATVWPCSAERPLASNLNFVSGQVVANNVIAPIGDQGSVCFYTNVPSDIIVDIAGYFSGEDGNQFVGSTPKRYIDTRSSLGPAPGAEPVQVEPSLPSVQLLEDNSPFADRVINLPSSSTNLANVTIAGSDSYTLDKYELQVSGAQATLINIVATDRNGFTSPQFVGLSEGMVVPAGSAVEFSLVTGLSGGRTSDLLFSFEVMETGDSFSSVYVFRSN